MATDCWEWVGLQDDFGYGITGVGGKPNKAHRVSYEAFVGRLPEGACVLHKCDNPRCVNPDHLFLGTRADNAADKVAKGRQRRHFGETNPNARLCADDIRAIRSSAETGKALSKKYGVSQTNISSIRLGKAWGHIL